MIIVSIERKESNAIKGLLIILIILGHSQPLTDYPSRLWSFLYCFHVHCFFILPFLYPVKELSYYRIKNLFTRFIIPYFMLFMLFFLTKQLQNINNLNTFPVIIPEVRALIMGGLYPLKKTIGIAYIWFMPCMFSMCILKDYYSNTSSYVRLIMIVAATISYFFLWGCLYCQDNLLRPLTNAMMDNSPVSIFQAMGALFLGITTVHFLRIVNKIPTIRIWIGGGLLLITFLFFFKASFWIDLISNLLLPTLMFSLLYMMRSVIVKSKILRCFGENSYAIYIVQSPLCIAFYSILPKFFETKHTIWGILATVFLLFSCYSAAIAISKNHILKRFLLSRTWEEFRGHQK